MEHVTGTLEALLTELRANRDNEISIAAEILPQYIIDHNDTEAYREVDRAVNRLARAWDRMIALLEKTHNQAGTIEASCENFYGH